MSATAFPYSGGGRAIVGPHRALAEPAGDRRRGWSPGRLVRREEDIVSAVAAARDEGEAVRVVGSAGSKNDCYRTDGRALWFGEYNRVLAIDGPRVVVQAGATVGQLNTVLRQHGLAVPTHGEWAGATLGGALATGTHGGALSHGIFASSIASLRVVTATGHVLELHRGTELFDHAAVSLGALGIVSTVTFDCVERFHLELVMRPVSFDTYLDTLESASREHEYFSAVWVPSARRVITFAADRVPAPARTQARRERFSVSTFLLSLLSRRVGLHAFPDSWFTARAVDGCEDVLSPIQDKSHRVQVLRFLSRDWKAAEPAVPFASAAHTLADLEGLLHRRRSVLTNPVGLRASAGDGFSLSPCYGQAMFWIDLFFNGNQAFAAELRDFFEARGARCHWGKHVLLSAGHLKSQYPRWEAFHSARRALDPGELFGNAFTRRFGL